MRSEVEALQVFNETGDVSGISVILVQLSAAAQSIGATEPAWRLRGAGVALSKRFGVACVYRFVKAARHPAARASDR